MTALLFTAPSFRPLSLTGAIMPNAYVQFYLTGTTTPEDVYADAALGTPLDNPVEANSAGVFPPIYLDRSKVYRAQIFDQNDVLQLDADPLGTSLDVQPGTVFMFFGTSVARDAAYPPALWQVCNGSNGSPDMRGRFPRSVDTGLSPGDTGGATTPTTSSDGAHTHTAATGSTVLTTNQMPAHNHRVLGDTNAVSTEVNGLGNALAQSIGGRPALVTTDPVDEVGTTGEKAIENTGGGAGHTHTISSDGAHTHTVSALPPFCVVWFIMRRA